MVSCGADVNQHGAFGGNPTTYTDPSGLLANWAAGALIGMGAGGAAYLATTPQNQWSANGLAQAMAVGGAAGLIGGALGCAGAGAGKIGGAGLRWVGNRPAVQRAQTAIIARLNANSVPIHQALDHATSPRFHKWVSDQAHQLGIVICFTAGTPLRTPDGSRVIEDIRPGDAVLSRDEHDPAGAVAGRVVEDVFVRQGLVWELAVGGRTIRTTAEHPF